MAITFAGQPITGVVPTGIRVLGPPLTGAQMAMVQSVFFSFTQRARLSVVGNTNEHGLLPDGSPYQISLIAGVAQMVVRTAFTESVIVSDMMHGILRYVNEETRPVGGEQKRFLEEFKANGEKAYSDVRGFYAAIPHDVLITPVWTAFAVYGLSGPAAVLAQFGRGAVAAYNRYLAPKGEANKTRTLGEGVVVLTHGGKKLAACYRLVAGNLQIARMEVIKPSSFGMRGVPPDILSLFGGVPIPPASEAWAVALYSGEIAAAFGLPDAYRKSEIEFPSVASTGNGSEAFFILSHKEYLDPPAPNARYIEKSRLMKFEFAVTVAVADPGPRIIASAHAAGDIGNSGFFLSQEDMPTGGVWISPYAVTHEKGKLNLFTLEIEFDSYTRVNGSEVRLVVRNTVKWLTGEVHTFLKETWKTASVRTTGYHRISVGDTLEIVTQNTSNHYEVVKFQTWTLERSATVAAEETFNSRKVGRVSGVGREGVYYVNRGAVNSYGAVTAGAISGSENITNTWPYRVWISTVGSYDGVAYSSYTNASPEDYLKDLNGVSVPSSEKAVLYSGLAAAPMSNPLTSSVNAFPQFPSGTSGRDVGFAMLGSMANVATNMPGATGSGKVTYTPRSSNFVSAKLHVRGEVFDIPAMEIMGLYDTEPKIDEAKKSELFAHEGPLAAINNYARVSPGVDLSQFGGRQILFSFGAYSDVAGKYLVYRKTWGTLVGGAQDSNYTKTQRGIFVGKLQP